jgi:thymidylate kinase
MTAPAIVVALEGTNGVGKTYLAHRAAALLGSRCRLVAELPDSAAADLPGHVISALRGAGDAFLRTGVPLTETLLLAALQVHRYESLPPLTSRTVVLEDRGPLSVAVYQAVILHPGDPDAALARAGQILTLIGQWRPLPSRVLLLTDDPGRCQDRAARRNGHAPGSSDLALIDAAAALYEQLAARDPAGYIVLDRRQIGEDACIRAIADLCAAPATAFPVRTRGGER